MHFCPSLYLGAKGDDRSFHRGAVDRGCDGQATLNDESRPRTQNDRCSCRAQVNIEQAGVPAVIPAESCYLGWQELLAQLTTPVEPEIPG